MKRSMNFAGSGATQRKRVTASSVADALSSLLPQDEIEQLHKEVSAEREAVDDILAHKKKNGAVPPRVMIVIAISNGLHPKRLMQLLENGEHIDRGATKRFEAWFTERGETWDSLIKRSFQASRR